MSNKILIEYQSKNNDTNKFEDAAIVVPLLDDILLEIQSQFSSFGEMVPQIREILELGTTLQSSIAGHVGETLLDVLNKLDVATWKRTEPLKFQTTLTFFNGERGAYLDVFKPITDLTAYTMLVKDGSVYKTPGANIRTISTVTEKGKSKSKITKTKEARLVTVYIPGIAYIPYCFIRTARPTFSKYRTTSGYPVWGKLDVQFESLTPASDQIWDGVKEVTKTMFTSGINLQQKADDVNLFKDRRDGIRTLL
jgi:hypothetical protein